MELVAEGRRGGAHRDEDRRTGEPERPGLYRQILSGRRGAAAAVHWRRDRGLVTLRRRFSNGPFFCECAAPRAQRLPVPELTSGADIKLNKRVSLQRCSATISFADEAGAPSRYCLDGRVARRGCCLGVVSVRLFRLDFRALALGPSVTLQLTVLIIPKFHIFDH